VQLVGNGRQFDARQVARLQPVGPMTVTLKLQESKANSGLKDSIFEIK